MFQDIEIAKEVINANFHEGFNLPRSGAREVDLSARRIQEAAESLSVSITEKNYI